MTPGEEQALLQQLVDLEEESIRWMRTDVSRTQAISDQMMSLSREAGPAARALALRVRGNCMRLQGRIPEALDVLRQSQRLWRKAGDEVQWARTVTAAIPALVQLDRNREATRASRAALDLFLHEGERAAAARLLNNMGAMYGNLGRPLAALDCFTRGEALARDTNQPSLRARFSQNRALVSEQLGRHGEALKACARALRYWRETGEQVAAARVLQVAAIASFHLGTFGKALKRFAAARATFETAAPRDVTVCDLYIAACYLELNRHDETLVRMRTVLERLAAAQEGPQYAWEYAWARLYEGVALARLGRRQESLLSLSEAHQWFKRHGYTDRAGRAKLEEAEVYLGQARPQEAIKAAQVAVRLFQASHQPADEARAHLVAAEGAFQTRRWKEAEEAVNRAHPIIVRAHMPGPLFRCLHLQGRIALQRNQREKARSLLTRAVATAERMRSTVQVAFRRAFLEDKSNAYADLVWLHLLEGRVAVAHRLIDRAKSRALVDALSSLPSQRAQHTPPADIPLLGEIEAARREYQALTMSAPVAPDVAVALRSQSGAPSSRRTQLEQRLAALWDEWELRQAASVAPVRARAEEARAMFRRLPAGGCMVEYFVAGSRLLAFVSDRRGLRGWVDLGAADPVRQGLELLQLNLDSALVMSATAGTVPPGVARNADALLHELYRTLWEPLKPLLGDRRRLVVVPHGILHLVPFEALFDGERYLVQQVEMVLAPSRAAWARCMDRAARQEGKADLVIGYNPDGNLPCVDEEVRRVAGALGTQPHLGQEATTGLLTGAGPCRVIHLAVHGEFRQDNPHFSTLLLANGPLTVADAAGLELDASLVVLSGCETGLSRITRGEELMGMISAFMQAGSASVLASRWRVDDRLTAELMQGFYDGLLAGKRKATALREAQAAMASNRVYPLYWAAFGLVGHGGLL